MFMESFKGRTLLRLFSTRTGVQAIKVTAMMVRARLVGEHQVVFYLSAERALAIAPMEVPDFSVESVVGWEAAQERIYGPLRKHMKYLPDNPEHLCQQGSSFWLGRLAGRIAAVGVSRLSDGDVPCWLKIPSGYGLLSRFATLPAYRGRGLYPALLVHIVRHMASHGTKGFLITCADWNIASMRGIKRVGFSRIGRGIIKRNGRFLYSADPSVVALEDVPVWHRQCANT